MELSHEHVVWRTGCTRIAAALAVLGFILCLPVGNGVAGEKPPLKIGDIPPTIDLSDTKGSNVKVPDDLRGKVVILQFWASGCGACGDEMLAMQTLYESYRRKGLVILAINVGQRKDIVKKWLQNVHISYSVLLDTDKVMARKYDVVDMPRTYLVDRKGVVRYKIVGNAPSEAIQKKIVSLL